MELFILGLLIVILFLIGGRLDLPAAGLAMAKASSAAELAVAAQAVNEAQQEGCLMEWYSLSLTSALSLWMVGMSVSPLAAAALAKESSAEVLAAAAQAFREALLQGRLM